MALADAVWYTVLMWPWSPFHPRIVHFPIALLLTGSAAAVIYMARWRHPLLAGLAWPMVLLGWLALFPAVLTGLIDQNRATLTEAATAVLNQHIAAGFGLIVIYGWLLYERLRQAEALDKPGLRVRLLLLFLLGIGLVLVSGTLGGKLVYQFGIGVQP